MQRDMYRAVPGKYRGKKRRSISFSGAKMWESVRGKRETLGGLIKNSWPKSANKTNRRVPNERKKAGGSAEITFLWTGSKK
jgi:hypothetical protein